MNKAVIPILLVLLTALSFAQSSASNQALAQQVCNIVSGIRTIIGVFALLFFFLAGLSLLAWIILFLLELLGGKENKKEHDRFKGYRTLVQKICLLLFVLGVIGVILVILTPFIVVTILGIPNSQIISC